MLSQNASTIYIMIGEPIVINETYINHILILEVARPNFSPIALQTPKAFNSKNDLNLFIYEIVCVKIYQRIDITINFSFCFTLISPKFFFTILIPIHYGIRYRND